MRSIERIQRKLFQNVRPSRRAPPRVNSPAVVRMIEENRFDIINNAEVFQLLLFAKKKDERNKKRNTRQEPNETPSFLNKKQQVKNNNCFFTFGMSDGG